MYTINLKNLCRLCMLPAGNMFNIFRDDKFANENHQITLSSKIMTCVSIEVSQTTEGPDQICEKCLDDINNWFIFKEACQAANILLQKYLQHQHKEKHEAAINTTIEQNLDESILFPEISLTCYDSLLERSVSLSPVLNEFNWEKTPKDKVPSTNEIADSFPNTTEAPQQPASKKQRSERDGILERTKKVATRKKVVCELCDSTFDNFTALLMHDKVAHPFLSQKHFCSICARLFVTRERLITHTKLIHGKRMFKCPSCDELFESRKKVNCRCIKFPVRANIVKGFKGLMKNAGTENCENIPQLATKERQEENISTTISAFEMQSRQGENITDTGLLLGEQLRRLQPRENVSETVLLQAQLSEPQHEERVPQTDPPARIHQNKLHQKENISDPDPLSGAQFQEQKRRYICELCNSKFTHFAHLLSHDESAHPTIRREHCCDTCRRLFISNIRLRTHNELAHKQKLLSCTECKKMFVSKKSLSVHFRLHTGKYKCEQCGFLSTSKVYLNQHMQKHQGNGVNFLCHVCHKLFTHKQSLLRHQKLHEKNQGKYFKCKICGALSRTNSELLKHMRTHSPSSPTEWFVCNICEKGYKSKEILSAHLRTHNPKQFTCSICEKKLRTRYDLRIHEETHSNIKAHSCFHCDKKFCFRNTLKNHLKKFFPRVRSDQKI